MIFLPKFKKCPCCNSYNAIRINGITYDNNFKSMGDWILKKKIKCKKCNEELALFVNAKNNKDEKLVWINHLKCEDVYFKQLNDLQISKDKLLINSKHYSAAHKRINDIQNDIRLAQVKLKIKIKIQNREIFNTQS